MGRWSPKCSLLQPRQLIRLNSIIPSSQNPQEQPVNRTHLRPNRDWHGHEMGNACHLEGVQKLPRDATRRHSRLARKTLVYSISSVGPFIAVLGYLTDLASVMPSKFGCRVNNAYQAVFIGLCWNAVLPSCLFSSNLMQCTSVPTTSYMGQHDPHRYFNASGFCRLDR